MTPENQRITIARACGYTNARARAGTVIGHKSNSENGEVPDYLGSLDAMHEAEKTAGHRNVDCRVCK